VDRHCAAAGYAAEHFAPISPTLTRRANHLHNDIIAKIAKPAPATAAGFFVSELRRQAYPFACR
jgi:hypothetical protein